MRDAGEPAPTRGAAVTLGDVLDAYRADQEGARTKKGEREPYRASTLLRDDASIKALRRYLDPDLPVTKLSRAMVVAAHRERARAHPKSAGEELALLRRALKDAEDKGTIGIDHGIHTIERSPVPRRTRRALTAREFAQLRRNANPNLGRGLLEDAELLDLLAFTGIRIGEALALRDGDIEIDAAGRMFLRIRTNKEGNPDKRIRVVHKGIRATLRRALRVRDATSGPTLLFRDEYRRPLTYAKATNRIFKPARRNAAAEWSREHPTHDPADNPFLASELTPHDLRSTFATILRTDGYSRETVATLLGHRDGGKLLDRVYDKSDRDELANREIDALDAAGDDLGSPVSVERTAAGGGA
jgi:integrase